MSGFLLPFSDSLLIFYSKEDRKARKSGGQNMYYDVKETAERIRILRTGSDLTQNEATEKMGLSLSGYRKLEQGQNGGSIDSLITVADYNHISLDYLVYGEERDYISNLSEGLTDNQKSIVRATIASLVQNIKRYQ